MGKEATYADGLPLFASCLEGVLSETGLLTSGVRLLSPAEDRGAGLLFSSSFLAATFLILLNQLSILNETINGHNVKSSGYPAQAR